MSQTCIDGVQPGQLVVPENINELAEFLAQAEGEGKSVIPMGNGTKLAWGNIPARADYALRTIKFDRVVDYEPADLTISVEAGCRLADVQRLLGEHGQLLATDPPYSDQATIGGIVACNASGPLRFRYGPLRDWVIGMKVAHADGQVSKAGGKVVKNVSGYDMCKLYTGSYGTLGVITEVNFKLQPKPEVERTCAIAFARMTEVIESLEKILNSPLMPSALELVSPRALQTINRLLGTQGPEEYHALLVRFSDVAQAVDWQTKELTDHVLSSHKQSTAVIDGEIHRKLWDIIVNFRSCLAEQGGHLLTIKAAVPHNFIGEVFDKTKDIEKKLRCTSYVTSHVGNGIIYIYLVGDNILMERIEVFVREFEQLRRFTTGFSGSAVIQEAPVEIKRAIDVWGFPTNEPSFKLMKAIKEKFDPKNILNPGRFVGGI